MLLFPSAKKRRRAKIGSCFKVINYYNRGKRIFRLKLAYLRFTQNQPQTFHLICTLADTWTLPQGTCRIFYWKEQQFGLISQGMQLSVFQSTILTTLLEFLPLNKRYSASLNSASATAALLAPFKAQLVLEFWKMNPERLMLFTEERLPETSPRRFLFAFKLPTQTLMTSLACWPIMIEVPLEVLQSGKRLMETVLTFDEGRPADVRTLSA